MSVLYQNGKFINIIGNKLRLLENKIKNAGTYPEINHGTSDTTFTLTPNTFHVWGAVTALDLSFGKETGSVANKFLFQFASDEIATTLTLPNTIKWANDEVPTIEPHRVYQISILRGLASVLEFNYYPFVEKDYMRIISLEDNSTISLPTNTSPNLMYSLGGNDWIQWDYSTITLGKDDILYIKGDNSNGFSTASYKYNRFNITGKVELAGNIMSLLHGDDFENNNTLPGTYTFYQLFYNCTGIVSAKDLVLPATTLADHCYGDMFRGCTSLTTAPELPATTLARSCYLEMFWSCTSLTTAPELHATTLAELCYYSMFRDCTSLTTAPELPATTLTDLCYHYMFLGCSKLNRITMLATDISANSCLYNWVSGVASSGTFVKRPDMTKLPSNIHGIPRGWTVENYNVPTPSIVNLTKNNDISFYYTDGLFAPTRDYIQLIPPYSEQQILSFKPQCDIFVDVYTKDNNNIKKSIEWSMDMTLFELINGLGIDNIDNLAIMIRSLYTPESDPYSSYGYYYY